MYEVNYDDVTKTGGTSLVLGPFVKLRSVFTFKGNLPMVWLQFDFRSNEDRAEKNWLKRVLIRTNFVLDID